MNQRIRNTSGWRPVGQAILLKAVQLADISSKILEIPDEVKQSSATRDIIGLVIAIGPDAWKDISPRCEVGDKVRFTQFAGGIILGDDSEIYRLVNAHAIYAVKEEAGHG